MRMTLRRRPLDAASMKSGLRALVRRAGHHAQHPDLEQLAARRATLVAAAAEGGQRMREQRRQVSRGHSRSRRRVSDKAREHPEWARGQRLAARESRTSMFHLSSSPRTRRASSRSGCDQCCRAARRLDDLAHRDRETQCLLALVRRLDQADAR